MQSTSHAEIAETIERTLLAEARANELKVATMRTFVVLSINGLDWMIYLRPRWAVGLDHVSITLPLLSQAWLVGCVALALILRRGWYRPWMRAAIPMADGVALMIVFLNARRVYGEETFQRSGMVTNIALGAALVAVSGGLRLNRTASILTTAVALVIFGVCAPFSSLETVRSWACLLSVGLIAVWMSAIVRRAMQSEIGRATLQRFLPKKVIERAHKDPLALLTEPANVDATVLISDLRGFTAMCERLAPADVLRFLSELQGAFAAVVRDHGGTVDKFMGDGMLAVFGAPEPMADHAERAVAAAVGLRVALARVNAARAARGEGTVALGVGIHSGAVVTGCLGSGARLEFTVIGNTVNIASRLEALTKEKRVDVIVSAETAKRAPSLAAGLEALGDVAVRGREEPLAIFALAREAKVRAASIAPPSMT